MSSHHHHSACCDTHNSQSETDREHSHEGDFDLTREILTVSGVALLLIAGSFWEADLHKLAYSWGEYAIFVPAYLMSGWTVLSTAGRNLLRGKIFDENFLMTIATLGAFAIHHIPEAVGVMLFYQVGELFQSYAVNRSRKSIKSLLEIRPDRANLVTDSGTKTILPEEIAIGEIIAVYPGEKIPLDGEVIEGSSFIDTSALTGESMPRSSEIGAKVLAGMINQSGTLKVRVTKLLKESSISKILDLVENATQHKAETQKFITKFANYYTPIVVFISLAVAILPPFFITGSDRYTWVYRALILLVISCPCGLVISIPLGYFGGIGGAARRGILVKGATYLDVLTQVKVIVFDKTGTLTQGVFKVTKIEPINGFSSAELIELAAKIESQSHHPIAKSIQQAYGEAIDPATVADYREVAGGGVTATIDGKKAIAGNRRFLSQAGFAVPPLAGVGTIVHLGIDDRYVGYICIADELKPDTFAAIKDLRELGVGRLVMLSGDSDRVASQISQELGLDEYRAELLPEDKVNALEEIMQKLKPQEKAMVVGDGINDAPMLARADVGVAMGGLGSDAAIETADVVVMNDSLTKLARSIEVSRKTRTIVWQNIIFAMAVKGLFIILGSFGVATMWEAVFADVGVAIVAIVNATRAIK